jgi:hypothetical protein
VLHNIEPRGPPRCHSKQELSVVQPSQNFSYASAPEVWSRLHTCLWILQAEAARFSVKSQKKKAAQFRLDANPMIYKTINSDQLSET